MMRENRAQCARRRSPAGRWAHGVTLTELIAVVIILGITTMIALGRLDPRSLANLGSEIDARRLALDLLSIQRRAISTGDNHYLEFDSDGLGGLLGYTLYWDSVAGPVEVEAHRTFTSGLTVTGTDLRAEFTFEGIALGAYQYTLAGPNRTRQVTVVPVTGAVRVVEL